MSDSLRDAALDYHRHPTPGKISVTPTKAMATQRDLGPERRADRRDHAAGRRRGAALWQHMPGSTQR